MGSLARDIGLVDDEGNIVLDGAELLPGAAATGTQARYSLARELGLEVPKGSARLEVVWSPSPQPSFADCLPFIDILEAAAPSPAREGGSKRSKLDLEEASESSPLAAESHSPRGAAVVTGDSPPVKTPVAPSNSLFSSTSLPSLVAELLRSEESSPVPCAVSPVAPQSGSKPVMRPLFGVQPSSVSPCSPGSGIPKMDDWLLSDGPPDFRPASHRVQSPRIAAASRKRGPQDALFEMLGDMKTKLAKFDAFLQQSSSSAASDKKN